MNKTVLIIEDDLEIIYLIRYILDEMGFKLIESSSKTYHEDIGVHHPDVILLDYWLGDTLGSSICMDLKVNPQTSNIPVILTSAVNGIGVIAENCHADDSLAKPFDITDLESKILKWAETPAETKPY
ncbi:MAG: response regulator [Daejeonella sp.]